MMNGIAKKTIIGLISTTMLGVTFGTTAVSASAHVQAESEDENIENIASDKKNLLVLI